MDRKKKLSFILASSILWSACLSTETKLSSELDQDDIHQSYFIQYNQEDTELTIEVSFRVNSALGASIELDGVSEINHDEFILSLSAVSTALLYRYSDDNASLQSSHVFTYMNNDSDVFRNLVEIPVSILDSLPSDVSSDEPLLVSWDEALIVGEEIEIMIRDENSFLVSTKQARSGSTSVIISSRDLSFLQPGTIRVQLKRTHESSLQEANSAGGRMTSVYLTTHAIANLEAATIVLLDPQ